MAGPDPAFWNRLFAQGTMPWDRGAANPTVARLIAEGVLRPGQRIVVPGCGSGYELEVLARAGLHAVGVDYAQAAIGRAEALRDSLPRDVAASIDLVQADVLDWSPGAPIDAVYEQTCLCALHPDHWQRYASRLREWLSPSGQLLAQFIQVHRPGAAEGRIEGPPYHCDINAMRALFTGEHWDWPKPPYARAEPRPGWSELLVPLTPRA